MSTRGARPAEAGFAVSAAEGFELEYHAGHFSGIFRRHLHHDGGVVLEVYRSKATSLFCTIERGEGDLIIERVTGKDQRIFGQIYGAMDAGETAKKGLGVAFGHLTDKGG